MVTVSVKAKNLNQAVDMLMGVVTDFESFILKDTVNE